LGDTAAQILKDLKIGRDLHDPPRSYYQIPVLPGEAEPGRLRGELRVYSPHFNRKTGRSVIQPELDPENPEHGEIAWCLQLCDGLAQIHHITGEETWIPRRDLKESASSFEEYLEFCLRQLTWWPRLAGTEDLEVIQRYLDTE
jgi:hypothetical protein